MLGEPIAGDLRALLQTVGREALPEAFEGACTHRLGTIDHQAKRGEVDPLQLLLGQLVFAQAVVTSAVRSRGHRRSNARYQGEPQGRSPQEVDRGEQMRGAAVDDAVYVVTEQAHVVIMRQPRHADLRIGRQAEPGVVNRIRMGDGDPARSARRSRCVLDEQHLGGRPPESTEPAGQQIGGDPFEVEQLGEIVAGAVFREAAWVTKADVDSTRVAPALRAM